MSDIPQALTLSQIQGSFPEGGLFRGQNSWLLSPEPLQLDKARVRYLQGLGGVLARFYDACNAIYTASAKGKESPWVASLLDTCKPEALVAVQRSHSAKGAMPSVIRPDLIMTEQGWALTELDSVPGGQGITAFLSQLYSQHGWNILGGECGMVEGFRRAYPHETDLLVSAESSDYRSETEYFVQLLGEGYQCCDAENYAQRQGVDVYRFFELFDCGNIPGADQLLAQSVESGGVRLSPPPVAHLEEKLWLALLHTPGLRGVWSRHMRGAHLERMKELVPHSWVVDPTPLPPQASLPWINAHDWSEVGQLSQKGRRLVLKISGFSELAWGSRGVYIGHDMSSEDWQRALDVALGQFESSPWILQEFHAGQVIEHPYYDRETGLVRTMKGRVRLCPYYYRDPQGKTELGGCLATIAPEDKKKIHGMKDAILVPVALATR
jgi:hypothetical protein